MIAPLPDDRLSPDQPAGQPRRRGKLAHKWANEVTSRTHVPRQPAEFEQLLGNLVDQLTDTLADEPFAPHSVTECGALLVAAGCTDPLAIQATMDVLGSGLLALPELAGIARLPQKTVQLLGAMAAGYAEALREQTFAHQESMSLALRKALADTRANLRAVVAQFDHLMADSASGVAITERDGEFIRTNTRLADILGYTPAELNELTLFDVAPDLRVSPDERTTQTRQKLIGKDGEATWVSLTLSATQDHLVVTMEDRTELDLLHGQLNHQTLHDMVTRLPNRQYFTTRLERALRQAEVAVYHLDLDAFSHVTHGLGRQAGDELLSTVGQRLEAMLAAEKAMVARIGADEFAILVENPATDAASTIRRIHETLAEPDRRGLVTSACIGVVDRPRGMAATEILDAAELALARAKRNGPGQWSSFHPAQDIRDREVFRRSVSPKEPVKLTHRPLVRLHDRAVVGLDAMLNVPGMPARLLRLAAGQAWQYPGLGIHIGLTSPMPEVLAILDETRLPADRLWLGMPVAAMTNDSVGPLADAGVRIEIRDFRADDIGQLAELPVHAVRIPHRRDPNFLVTEAMKSLTALVHMTEAEVIVDGVDTEQQAEWWERVGADTATGDFHSGQSFPR